MRKQNIRKPKQQRSIEKRKRIIEAGYQLFCEKGYFNTNTAEIAKRAGVSTGIIYRYFRDKKDIFIVIIEEYFIDITSSIYDILKTIQEPMDFRDVVKHLIDTITKSHTMIKSVHDEIMSLSKTDDDIKMLYYRYEREMEQKIITAMHELDIHPSYVKEKVHIIVSLIESLIHESIYQKHESINYDVIKEEIVSIVVYLLSD